MDVIQRSLLRLFEQHRVVFWYDTKRELRAQFEALALPDITVIELENNQFGLKHRILRGEPKQKFLLFHDGPEPEPIDNWLLDVQLAHTVFRADQGALWLNELGLGVVEFGELADDHPEFFKAAARRNALKERLTASDSLNAIRLKMLAVCAGSESRLDETVEHLLAELSREQDDALRLIRRSNLEEFLWARLARAYGYESSTPGLRDFAIALFKSGYARSLGEEGELNAEALVFLRRWKNNVLHHDAFDTLSAEYAGVLDIRQDLEGRGYTDLVRVDLFELIDRKIIVGLAADVTKRTQGVGATRKLISQRRQTHWFARYRHHYAAIEAGAEFLAGLEKMTLTPQTLDDGVRQYSTTWYRMDQLYRQTLFHTHACGETTVLGSLVEEVERRYANSYLLTLNDRWQQVLAQVPVWKSEQHPMQIDFFDRWVRPVLARGNKMYVIISDALRYEAADELLSRIRSEDRYEAVLAPMLSTLPSHTALGMAALLPHDQLAYSDDAKSVQADGRSTQGTDNRSAILDAGIAGGRGLAITAKDLLALNKDESRNLVRDYDVIYVYHNRIDAVGDTKVQEYDVLNAVDRALDEVIRLVKKLANANATNLIVTADHGFLYQHRPLDASDYLGQEPHGRIVKTDRRYVLGHNLTAEGGFKHFTAGQVGLSGAMEFLIPNSINRLRKQGAGSLYVHGGASLQEVVVPVLAINKKRRTDTTVVNVDVLRNQSSTITSGQVTVVFYQSEPVSEKVHPRTVVAGFYSEDGTLISDRHELTFEFRADDARERELPVQFILTRHADEYNGQDIVLRLDEREGETSHYRRQVAARYLLRRSFTTDFDF